MGQIIFQTEIELRVQIATNILKMYVTHGYYIS